MTTIGDNCSIADVYAGDTSIPEHLHPDAGRDFVFSIQADSEPHVLARVAMILDLTNLAPRRVLFQSERGDVVSIEAEIGPIGGNVAEIVRRKLEQLTCVHDVLVARRMVGLTRP